MRVGCRSAAAKAVRVQPEGLCLTDEFHRYHHTGTFTIVRAGATRVPSGNFRAALGL